MEAIIAIIIAILVHSSKPLFQSPSPEPFGWVNPTEAARVLSAGLSQPLQRALSALALAGNSARPLPERTAYCHSASLGSRYAFPVRRDSHTTYSWASLHETLTIDSFRCPSPDHRPSCSQYIRPRCARRPFVGRHFEAANRERSGDHDMLFRTILIAYILLGSGRGPNKLPCRNNDHLWAVQTVPEVRRWN